MINEIKETLNLIEGVIGNTLENEAFKACCDRNNIAIGMWMEAKPLIAEKLSKIRDEAATDMAKYLEQMGYSDLGIALDTVVNKYIDGLKEIK